MTEEKILHVECELTQYGDGNNNSYNLTIKDQFGETILNNVWIKESEKNWRGKINDYMGTTLNAIFENVNIRKYFYVGNQKILNQ